jgi:HAD superfamily hydrolase (TIGR01549 family)
VEYRAVLFDLDDTLLRAIETYWDHHRAVCREIYGFELSDEELRAHWGKPYKTFLPAIYRNSDTYENMLAAERSVAHRFRVSMFDDALSTVATLLEAGVLVGILTSADRAIVLADFEQMDFPIERLAVLQTSDDTDVHKPDPAVFDPAIERLGELGVQRNEVLYVGDNLTDFFAARDAKIAFLGVTTGLITENEFRGAGATNITDRLGPWFMRPR